MSGANMNKKLDVLYCMIKELRRIVAKESSFVCYSSRGYSKEGCIKCTFAEMCRLGVDFEALLEDDGVCDGKEEAPERPSIRERTNTMMKQALEDASEFYIANQPTDCSDIALIGVTLYMSRWEMLLKEAADNNRIVIQDGTGFKVDEFVEWHPK